MKTFLDFRSCHGLDAPDRLYHALDLNDKQTNVTAHNLTNHGATEYTADVPYPAILRAAALAAASSQYLETANQAALNLTVSITIEAWVKRTSTGAAMVIMAKDNGVTTINYDLYFTSGNNIAFVYTTGGGSQDTFTTIGTLTDTTSWHHIAFSYTFGTGASAVMYVDTVLSAGAWSVNGNGAVDADSSRLLIGALDLGPTSFGDHKLADIRLYNTARTALAIAGDYNTLPASNAAGLVGWWPFQTIGSPSPSLSLSASPSVTPSSSVSRSPSLSVSLSPSNTPSASISRSPSASVSPSSSPSLSRSASLSPSQAPGSGLFSKQASLTIPTTKANLEIIYGDEDEADVAEEDDIRVEQTGINPYYVLHQYRIVNTNNKDKFTIRVNLRSTYAPLASPIRLQIWNVQSGSWETLATNSTSPANADIDLTASIDGTQDAYYDTNFEVAVRVYQLLSG